MRRFKSCSSRCFGRFNVWSDSADFGRAWGYPIWQIRRRDSRRIARLKAMRVAAILLGPLSQAFAVTVSQSQLSNGASDVNCNPRIHTANNLRQSVKLVPHHPPKLTARLNLHRHIVLRRQHLPSAPEQQLRHRLIPRHPHARTRFSILHLKRMIA